MAYAAFVASQYECAGCVRAASPTPPPPPFPVLPRPSPAPSSCFMLLNSNDSEKDIMVCLGLSLATASPYTPEWGVFGRVQDVLREARCKKARAGGSVAELTRKLQLGAQVARGIDVEHRGHIKAALGLVNGFLISRCSFLSTWEGCQSNGGSVEC